MPIEQNLLAYRESISEELDIAKNRVRRLIGSAHWQTDGEHKESVLRKVIRALAPETLRIGRGFVCFPQDRESSGQIDILITSKSSPTLYRDENLVFVTSNAAEAIIEVKTELKKGAKFKQALRKLTDELEKIRSRSNRSEPCWGGLFIYNSHPSLSHEYVLESLQSVTGGRMVRAVNCVSIGVDTFIRFWRSGHPETSPERLPMWHSYNLRQLAQPYFIGNLIFHVTPGVSLDDQLAWFPIPGTKETQRCYYAKLTGRKAQPFP